MEERERNERENDYYKYDINTCSAYSCCNIS